jgi:DNA-directed RNA polymerase specialized sigma24 family protein
MAEPSHAPGFPTTRWSRVVAAGDRRDPGTREALASLCGDYWYPLYALIRRKGHDPERALDLTQAYFARLLETPVIAAADPAKGRFRAFLRTDCGHFLADQGDRDRAIKRGGDRRFIPIDAEDAENRYRIEPAHELTPERLFDRAWAVDLLDSVFRRLEREYAETGRAALFAKLKGVMTGENARHATIAAELGTTEVAIEAASRRLRKRFREALREAISATLDGPDSLDDEIRDLFAALAR